jgi:hypothetical protein
MKAAIRGRLEDLQSNDEDDETLENPAGGVEGRQVADKGAVKNTKKMARKGVGT